MSDIGEPSPEEVAADVAAMWDDVIELASTPEGREMMQAAADAYPIEDE